MENDTLVVAAANMADEVFHSFRRLLREQAHVDIPNSCVDRGRVRMWRRAGALRYRRRRDSLLFTRRPLIEDITFSRFIIPGIE